MSTRHFYSPNHLRFNMEFVMETKSSYRDDVIAALRSARMILKDGTESMIRKANRTIVECKNQRALLDAISYGFIHPVPGQG